MKTSAIDNILKFLETKENKKIPQEWVDLKPMNSLIEKFENHPDGVQYRHEGDFDLSGSKNRRIRNVLPNDLYVQGTLWLSKPTKLPDKLHVEGHLLIWDSNIRELPDNLHVGYDLSLLNTNISELPNKLFIGGDLFIENTTLAEKYTNEEIIEMITSKGGQINGEIRRAF